MLNPVFGGVEITTSYHRDDTTIEMKIKLGTAYPLKNAEVEVSSLLGISKERWQRWKLQIIQLLTNSNYNRSQLGTSSSSHHVSDPDPGHVHDAGISTNTKFGSTGGSGGSIIEAIHLWISEPRTIQPSLRARSQSEC